MDRALSHVQSLSERIDVPADEAWKAMLALAGDQEQTIPFVMEQLKQRATGEQVQQLIDDLGHTDFSKREKAKKTFWRCSKKHSRKK